MCEQIPTREYESGFLAKWQDTFYGGFTSAECPWITSCGTGRSKQMHLSFSFFLRDDKLKALMQTVIYLALSFIYVAYEHTVSIVHYPTEVIYMHDQHSRLA
jgi:hypothetical protein